MYGGDDAIIRHSGSCTLTIIDSSESGNGWIGSAISSRNTGGTIYLEGGTADDTVLIIKSGAVQSHYNGAGIFNKGNGSVIIIGTSTVQNNSFGPAIHSTESGKFAISENAKVTSKSSHSTIYFSKPELKGSVLEITGGTIENTGSGYAIYSVVNYAVSVPGGTPVIKGNNAVNKGIDPSGYAEVLVMASEYDTNGARDEEIYPSWLKLESYTNSYKYLKFSPAPHVARIGDKEYTSLYDAFYEVQDGQTVVLLEDINLKESLYPEKNFTLDLNGKTISETVDAGRLPSYLGMIVCWEGTLTITDSSGGGTVAGSTRHSIWAVTPA